MRVIHLREHKIIVADKSLKHREKVNGHEIDFLIEDLAIEIDGHQQSSKRNKMLFDLGWIPVHYNNLLLIRNRDVIEKDIKDVRSDIFNLGDRFVSYHMFDKLASRVNMLEKKVK